MQTREVPDTLDAVAASFRDARGDGADADWARSAAVRFALDDIRAPLARQALWTLVPTIAESQEPAHALFGDPVAWARERQAAWRAEGVPAKAPPGPTSVPEFVHDLLVGAAVIAAVMTPLRMLVDGWTYDLNVALVLFPVLMSTGILGLPVVWRATVRRRSRVVAAVGLLLAYCASVAGSFAVLYPVSFGQASGWWMLAVATGYGLLARAVGRHWPAPEEAGPAEGPETDDAWKRGLAASLRQRGDFTEARVRSVVDEAVTHAADSGRSLRQEFGPSRGYAERFAPDAAVRRRRSAWSWTLLSVAPLVFLGMYLAEDGWHWQAQFIGLAVWFAAAISTAAVGWRRVAALGSRPD